MFEPGNKFATEHGKKPRVIEDCIKRAITQDKSNRLRKGIERVLTKFAEGDQWAVTFITERLDGKVVQQLVTDSKVEFVLSVPWLTQASVGRGWQAKDANVINELPSSDTLSINDDRADTNSMKLAITHSNPELVLADLKTHPLVQSDGGE